MKEIWVLALIYAESRKNLLGGIEKAIHKRGFFENLASYNICNFISSHSFCISEFYFKLAADIFFSFMLTVVADSQDQHILQIRIRVPENWEPQKLPCALAREPVVFKRRTLGAPNKCQLVLKLTARFQDKGRLSSDGSTVVIDEQWQKLQFAKGKDILCYARV